MVCSGVGVVCKHPAYTTTHRHLRCYACNHLLYSIGGSTTHLNVGGCADRIESIARPLVCAIMYPRYGFAVRGLMSSVISTIHPNPPLSALRFFSLLRFGKTKLLFCSHLNCNADKEGLWQGGALHMLRFVKRTLTHYWQLVVSSVDCLF